MARRVRTKYSLKRIRGSSQRPDVLTPVEDVQGVNSICDDQLQQATQMPGVSGFEELRMNYDLNIYSYIDTNDNKLKYSLVKPDNIPDCMITEISLSDNEEWHILLYK